ncbi:MAG: phenylalanine--tRNA ligase subunit alpha [Chlamydiales bacterium]
MNFEETIEAIKKEAQKDLEQSKDLDSIETLRLKYLGKKGYISKLMTDLRNVSPSLRPRFGDLINKFKSFLEEKIATTSKQFEFEEINHRLSHETLDVTLPGSRRFIGRQNVILKVLHEAIDILINMGFSVQYGPDIDSDFYNFEALNFSKNHPARDMHDTFYLTEDLLIRTHTSNTQVRVMESCQPPIRMIAPGKCYRNENISARSHLLFHQIEGLYIDEDVTFADLLSTIEEFFTRFFQQTIKMRYRPSYFPFVEPGIEVDISCIICDGKGCGICKYTGWLEVVGAGMVHPEVMKSGGIDPEKYLGYAWGFGIERLAMIRFGINDIRLFLENDLRFLQQF